MALTLKRLLLVPLLAGLGVSGARAEPLRVDRSAERMRVDGALREWRGARFQSLGSGDDAAVRFALATVEGEGLYLAAEVSDERLVRKAGVGPTQDALVLTLAMPAPDAGVRAIQIWLHPGKPAESKAAAGVAAFGARPSVERGIKVVEGPREGGPGYVLEAFVPFGLIPGSEIWEQGRGSLRFDDVDSEQKPRVEQVLQSDEAERPSELPRLALGTGQSDLLGSFLSAQGLEGVEPRYDFRGQVAGDAAPERVVIVDRYVLVYGPHYREGKGFSSLTLPFGTGGGLKRAELRDVTGDGIAELLCVVRQRNELGAREVWLVVTFGDERPHVMFGIELRKEIEGGFIETELKLEKKSRAAPVVRVRLGRAAGLSRENYRETPQADVASILVPWGEVQARAYQFDGSRFAVVDEERQRATASVKPAPARREREAAVAYDPPVPPTVEAVLDLFRTQRGLPAKAAPSRHLRANLLGSRALEDVFVYASELLFIGPDLGGGASFFAYALPLADSSDLLHVGAADVTGDGRAELFVRVRQVLAGADGVKRGVMLVHHFDDAGRFSRVLSVEAFRYQGRVHIANHVGTRGGVLVVSPGDARGWNAETYPFADEAPGGVGRLLLPWKDRPVRYRFAAGALTPQ